MLTNHHIKTIVEDAFKPFRCIVEMREHEQMRFKVMKRNRPVYIDESFSLADARDEKQLGRMLRQIRQQLADEGHQLDPW